MKLNTRYFGTIDYDDGERILFPEGLWGFEDERYFLMLPFEPENRTMLCLQSVATPALSFVIMDPFSLYPDYAPMLRDEELQRLQVKEPQDLSYYVLCAMRRPIETSTVNLKCPVAINVENRTAVQVILDTDAYQMRHRLPGSHSGDGDGPC